MLALLGSSKVNSHFIPTITLLTPSLSNFSLLTLWYFSRFFKLKNIYNRANLTFKGVVLRYGKWKKIWNTYSFRITHIILNNCLWNRRLSMWKAHKFEFQEKFYDDLHTKRNKSILRHCKSNLEYFNFLYDLQFEIRGLICQRSMLHAEKHWLWNPTDQLWILTLQPSNREVWLLRCSFIKEKRDNGTHVNKALDV